MNARTVSYNDAWAAERFFPAAGSTHPHRFGSQLPHKVVMDATVSANSEPIVSGQSSGPQCPLCGSAEVRRSRRRGPVERFFLRFLGRSPYRCDECDARFYRRRHNRHSAKK